MQTKNDSYVLEYHQKLFKFHTLSLISTHTQYCIAVVCVFTAQTMHFLNHRWNFLSTSRYGHIKNMNTTCNLLKSANVICTSASLMQQMSILRYGCTWKPCKYHSNKDTCIFNITARPVSKTHNISNVNFNQHFLPKTTIWLPVLQVRLIF